MKLLQGHWSTGRGTKSRAIGVQAIEVIVTEFKDYVVVVACFRIGQAQHEHREQEPGVPPGESKTVMGKNKPITLTERVVLCQGARRTTWVRVG